MATNTGPAAGQLIPVHSRFVRVTHWLNAIAIIVMIGSGWRIYDNVPIFPWLTFPVWATLGGDPEITYKLNKDVGFSNALLWHFAFMWLFFINGAVALSVGLLSGRLRRKWLPISVAELVHDLREALSFNLAHDDITIYNAVQKLLYTGVVLAMILMLASGLAIWKPVQFGWLTWLCYDFQGARLVHFLGMSAIALFLLVHVTLAVLVPQTIVAMTTGSIRVAAPADEPAAAPIDEPAESAVPAPAEPLADSPAREPAEADAAPADAPAHESAELPADAPIDAPHATKAGERL
ncbi:MAG: cytochrome b/b6 domain-containing protein [Rhodomicrobium sp.]